MHENLSTTLYEYLYQLAAGSLTEVPIQCEAACGVVLSGAGFPFSEAYMKHGHGKHVPQIEEIYSPGMLLYHMERDEKGFKTSGYYGEILCAVGLGCNIKEATEQAYEIIKSFDFDKNLGYRTDINKKFDEEELEWFQSMGYLPYNDKDEICDEPEEREERLELPMPASDPDPIDDNTLLSLGSRGGGKIA
jgi:hypothetical protein